MRSIMEAQIAEETIGKETGGHYGSETIAFTATANQETTHDFVPEIPISMLSAFMPAKGLNDGDEVHLDIGPETTVGTITADVAAAATTVDVPQSVIDLFDDDTLYIGMCLHLDDGTNKDKCGVVTAYDATTKTVDIQTATTNSFLAATPTSIKMTGSMTPSVLGAGKVIIHASDHAMYHWGLDKIGGSRVDAGKTIRITYKNTHATNNVSPRITFGYLY